MARTGAALVFAVALLFSTGTAGAFTYCVGTTPGPCDAHVPDVQTALTTAEGVSGPDTVQIGPGTYDGGTGFVYNSGDPVDVVGTGPAATILVASDTGSFRRSLWLMGSSASTVSQLGLKLAAGTGPIGLQTPGSATDIAVTSDPAAVAAKGVSLGANSVLRRASITLPHSLSGVSNGIDGNGAVTIEDTTIDADQGMFTVGIGTLAHVRRVVVHANVGIVADGNDMSLEDSLVISKGTNPVGLQIANDPPTLDANHVTLIGPGTAGATALQTVQGLLRFRNSIARGYPVMFDRAANSSIETDYSDYSGTRQETGAGAITESHQLDVDPQFVSPLTGDFQLAAGSPLINAGDPAGLTASESPVDLASAPRISGGRRDIGAYELQFPPPFKDTTAPAFSNVFLTNKTFAVGRASTPISAKKPKTGTTFRYTLSEIATVKLAIEQKTKGRRVGKRCRKPTRRSRGKRCTRYVKKGTLTRSSKAGPNFVQFSGRIGRRALRPGSCRVTITATDLSGNPSKTARLSFKIVKKR